MESGMREKRVILEYNLIHALSFWLINGQIKRIISKLKPEQNKTR
jgi:hypothetical protein